MSLNFKDFISRKIFLYSVILFFAAFAFFMLNSIVEAYKTSQELFEKEKNNVLYIINHLKEDVITRLHLLSLAVPNSLNSSSIIKTWSQTAGYMDFTGYYRIEDGTISLVSYYGNKDMVDFFEIDNVILKSLSLGDWTYKRQGDTIFIIYPSFISSGNLKSLIGMIVTVMDDQNIISYIYNYAQISENIKIFTEKEKKEPFVFTGKFVFFDETYHIQFDARKIIKSYIVPNVYSSLIVIFIVIFTFIMIEKHLIDFVIKPISNLSKYFKKIQSGIYEKIEQEFPKIEEIEIIKYSYNAMVEELKTTLDRLETAVEEAMALNEELTSAYRNLERALNSLGTVDPTLDLEEFGKSIINRAIDLIPAAHAGSIILRKKDQKDIYYFVAAVGFNFDILKKLEFKAEYSKIFESRKVLEVESVLMKYKDSIPKEIFETFKKVGSDKIKRSLQVPLIVNDQVVGGFFIDTFTDEPFTTEDKMFASFFGKVISIFLLLKEESENIEKAYNETLVALVKAIEIKDPYTRGHSERVASLAVGLAKELGITSRKKLKVIWRAAILHDIGKIGVRGAVLNKPDKLTDNEFSEIKRHPILGYELISVVSELENEAKIILHHHERWDGLGYPDGLKGEEIPFEARIIAVVDAFDAMTSDRPYRKALSVDKAIQIIKENAGKQFDPEIAKVAVKFLATKRAEIEIKGY